MLQITVYPKDFSCFHPYTFLDLLGCVGSGERKHTQPEGRQRKEAEHHHSLVCLPPQGWEDLTNSSVSFKLYQDMVRIWLNYYLEEWEGWEGEGKLILRQQYW